MFALFQDDIQSINCAPAHNNKQELLILHEHLCSLPIFVGSVLTVVLVFCVVLRVCVLFVFGLCLVC